MGWNVCSTGTSRTSPPGSGFTSFIRLRQPLPVPLYYAALCGFRDMVERVVEAHPQDVKFQGGMRVPPLNATVEKRYQSVAMLLLERGADMESRDLKSRIPLHIALYLGYADVASLPIRFGANLNAEFNRSDRHTVFED